ncbi:MAG: hypothetical protein HQ581_13025 [Planctomycetes bacterium]|nr:hypothetical protein [Planctomycetota bacterium]
MSLQLVHAKNVLFKPDRRKESRWVAEFGPHCWAPPYRISVTDPIATNRLNQGQRIGHECLLTVSLTRPIAFPRWNIPELCYKVVVAVIEIA